MSPALQQLDIERLNTSERLELIGLLWDSIVDADVNAAIPEWHLRELEQRRAEAEANPGSGIPWEAVKARLTRHS